MQPLVLKRVALFFGQLPWALFVPVDDPKCPLGRQARQGRMRGSPSRRPSGTIQQAGPHTHQPSVRAANVSVEPATKESTTARAGDDIGESPFLVSGMPRCRVRRVLLVVRFRRCGPQGPAVGRVVVVFSGVLRRTRSSGRSSSYAVPVAAASSRSSCSPNGERDPLVDAEKVAIFAVRRRYGRLVATPLPRGNFSDACFV